MAEAPVAVASAVILPEIEEQSRSPNSSLKRRQSSISDLGSKRPRLSQDDNSNRPDPTAMSPPQSAREERLSDRRKIGQMQEERKRGQRLFGALLGTLSQSSSSTANKRRADIEKKQQGKLRMQTEEDNEKKKAELEDLMAMRRMEQKKYDRESMRLRHSNLLSQANFFSTQAEPKLYYKPWELLPGDEEKLKDQLKEAEDIIHQELSQYEIDHPSSPKGPPPDRSPEIKRESEWATNGVQDTDGKNADVEKPEEPKNYANDANDTTLPNTQQTPPEQPEIMKDTGDDGGEVVEGEEDTVIY